MKPRRDRAQRRPRRHHRRGGAGRGAAARATSAAPAIDVFEHEPPDRLAAARRPEHAPHAAPRRVHRRGPGPGRRGGRRADPRRPRRPAGPLRGQRAAAHARDRPGDRAVPAARGDRSAGSSPSSPGAASRRSPSRSPASWPGYDASPLTAAVLRGPPRDGHDRAGQPRQRRRARQGARDHRSWSARRPRRARSPRN